MAFSRLIGAPLFNLSVIEQGYKLPFIIFPEPSCFRNNRSALLHAQFVESAIAEPCQLGRVVECGEHHTVVNPLSVSVQASGKKRLILDLSYFNTFLEKKRVKYWKVAMSYFSIVTCLLAFYTLFIV